MIDDNNLREHALLSASSADRWLHCTPSAQLNDAIKEVPSIYAIEGTYAHRLAEMKLNSFISKDTKDLDELLCDWKKAKILTEEMDRTTTEYLEYIKEIINGGALVKIMVEDKVWFDKYAPFGFGTADCILVQSDALHIVDFKYGMGVPVSATDNPQLKLYALGVMDKYGMIFNFDKIVLHIFQPRINYVNSWETTKEYLWIWGKSIETKANAAFNGEGEFNVGDWCRFCNARGICKHRAEKYIDLEYIKPNILTYKEIGEALEKTEGVTKWRNDIERYAMDKILSGSDIPGYKLVEGRSSRIWTDEEAAMEKLRKSGLRKKDIYETKPLSLAKIEKFIGKSKFEETVGEFVTKSEGKPTLVPESDKRESITNKVEDVFKEVNQ